MATMDPDDLTVGDLLEEPTLKLRDIARAQILSDITSGMPCHPMQRAELIELAEPDDAFIEDVRSAVAASPLMH